MAKKPDYDGDTALQDAPAAPKNETARDRFINRCLHDWALQEFMLQRGCDPGTTLVQSLAHKAGRMFDQLFANRPITSNL